MTRPTALLASALTLWTAAPLAAETATELPPMQVTATREAAQVESLPASVSVVTGEELRARGATDLRTALALVAGVQGTPTGDAGPAGSVPALWGLREIDSFLLVIDGVPAGGAFNPLTLQVDLTGVERIEVLRGAAPVVFGATSFNGVIHVIHYAPGQVPATAGAFGGTYGTYGAYAYTNVGEKQSLTANVESRGFSMDRVENQRYHLLYRYGEALGDDGFRADVDLSVVPQVPGSTVFRNGANLRTDLVPADANHNPADAKMDQKHYRLNLGYQAGGWASTLSLASTKDAIIRGFHEANATTAAHGYEQERELFDVYFDTHLTRQLAPALTLTAGFDYLYGRGEQEAFRFPYSVGADGSNPQDSGSARTACVPDPNPADEECIEAESEVERNFAGLYLQAQWQAADAVEVLAGLRLNQTEEVQEGEDEMTMTTTRVEDGNTRLSGVLGASWNAFRAGNDSLTLYADWRNSFKPIAAELAPEPAVQILKPETANSYEVGVKGALADGRLHYDASAFHLDFRNQRVLVGPGVFGNAGETRFQGVETELRYAVGSALQFAASYAYHDGRFIHFNRDGTPAGVVDNNRFELSPFHQAALGLIHAPVTGLNASAVANHTGARMLNKSNTLKKGAFTTIDASIGYEFAAFGVKLTGHNLTDRRDVIAESELSEELSGASSYYLLPGRSALLSVHVPL